MFSAAFLRTVKKGNVSLTDGPSPYPGGSWKHVVASWFVSGSELQRPPREIVDLILERRAAAALDVMKAIDKEIDGEGPFKFHGRADRWFVETVFPVVAGQNNMISVAVDSTFAIEKVDLWPDEQTDVPLLVTSPPSPPASE